MGVLEQMRSGSDSTFMQILMGAVVVSVLGWMAFPQGDTTEVVATVNGTPIMEVELATKFTSQMRQIEQRSGSMLSDDDRKVLREQVRQQLIEDEVVLQEARDLGLEVDDDEVVQAMARMFAKPDGTFDADAYRNLLRRRRTSKAAFEEQTRDQLLRDKLRQMIYSGASLSEPLVQQYYVESSTEVDLTYVRLRAEQFWSEVVIDDAKIDAWLQEDEELAKEIYDRDFATKYRHPAQVDLQMIRIVLKSGGLGAADLLPKLNVLKERAEGGADFGELAKRWSEDPSAVRGGSRGLMKVTELGADVVEAVEKLEVGQITRPIATSSDLRLYRLVNRVEPYEDSFDDVKRDIAKQEIQKREAPTLVAEFADKELLTAWKTSGDVPSELLEPRSITAIPTGLKPLNNFEGPFDLHAKLVTDVRQASEGDVLPEVYEAKGVLYVAQLTQRKDADMDVFEAKKADLKEQYLLQRRNEFYDAWRADAVARADVK